MRRDLFGRPRKSVKSADGDGVEKLGSGLMTPTRPSRLVWPEELFCLSRRRRQRRDTHKVLSFRTAHAVKEREDRVVALRVLYSGRVRGFRGVRKAL